MDWKVAVEIAEQFVKTRLAFDEFQALITAASHRQRLPDITPVDPELVAFATRLSLQATRPSEAECFAAACTGALASLRKSSNEGTPLLLIGPAAWIPPDAFGQVADIEHSLVELLASAQEEVILMAPFEVAATIASTARPLAALNRRVRLRILISGSSQTVGNLIRELKVVLPPETQACCLLHCRSSPHAIWPHAKLLLVDRKRGYLGSANFTPGGLQNYFEVGVLLSAEQATLIAHRIFPKLLSEVFTETRLLTQPSP